MTTGNRIKSLRLQHKLTLQDVATYLGIQKPTVQRYESGIVKNIPLEKLELLAKLFNVTTDYLISGVDFDKWDAEIVPKLDKADNFEKLLLILGYTVSKELYQSKEFYYEDEIDDNGNIVGRSKLPVDEYEIFTIKKDNVSIRLPADDFLKLYDDLLKIVDLSAQLNNEGRNIIINTLSGLLTSEHYNKKGTE